MTKVDTITLIRPQNAASESSPHADMVWIPGGTFRMGSDRHYAEEAPVHRVTVGGFWIDRTPVTNRQFREFVRTTGHVTFAEIAPDPKDYPGALPHMLRAGSLVFAPPKHPVDLGDWSQWWAFTFGANWRRPYGPRSSLNGLNDHPVVHVAYNGRWVEQALYLPQCGGIGCRTHRALALLAPPLQHAAMELLRGTMTRHNFIAYRDDRGSGSQPITFDGDAWRAGFRRVCHGPCAFGTAAS